LSALLLRLMAKSQSMVVPCSEQNRNMITAWKFICQGIK
jgi:hypothetical protein